MVLIPIVNGVYKSSYNWGGHIVEHKYHQMSIWFPIKASEIYGIKRDQVCTLPLSSMAILDPWHGSHDTVPHMAP